MPATLADFPLSSADLCVKCGLCLPHCPTYRETQHEGDSPRGRIALMQALATDFIPLTSTLERHLDGCLGCRACEPACPAHVPYGQLIDAGRELLLQKKPQRASAMRWLAPWLIEPRLRNMLGFFLWSYQRSGLQWLVRSTRLLGRGRMARLESLLPRLTLPRRFHASAPAPQVSLFTGCTGTWADRETLDAALQLVKRLGIATDVPSSQTCCGALHQHAGMKAGAATLARKNFAAFGLSAHPVLCTASGCTATLQEYAQIAGAGGANFSQRVQDISAFLLSHWKADVRLKPLHARVALHTPCTMKNVVKQVDATRALLQKIPGLELIELDARASCCGAAGSYLIQQPEMADRLLEEKLNATLRIAPDYIVSSNIGCTMHLIAGLRRRGGLRVPVLHPVTLLARQLVA